MQKHMLCDSDVCVCVCFRSELSDHVESIDGSLENLQSILNTQTFTFDTSPLMEVSVLTTPTVCVCVCVHASALMWTVCSVFQLAWPHWRL